MAFCEDCGVEIGFFSRKRLQRADGRVAVVCKACAERVVQSRLVARADEPLPTAEPAGVSPIASKPVESSVAAPSTYVVGGDPELLFQFLVEQFRRETGIDISTDAAAVQRLRVAATRAADELTTSEDVDVNLPFLSADSSGPKHLWIKVRAR